MKWKPLSVLACALAATSLCTSTLHAQDAYDLVRFTMMEAFYGVPNDHDHGLFIYASSNMEIGEVIIGRRHATNEQAILIIENSYSVVEYMGLDPDTPFDAPDEFREHQRQIHGLLIGSAATVNVTALATPTPNTEDDWFILPSQEDANFFDGFVVVESTNEPNMSGLSTPKYLTDGDGLGEPPLQQDKDPKNELTQYERHCLDQNGRPKYDRHPFKGIVPVRRFCICNPDYDCHDAANTHYPTQPGPCPPPFPPGASETERCLKTALCRYQIDEYLIEKGYAWCHCERVKLACAAYKKRFGNFPDSPMWKGRPNLNGCAYKNALAARAALLALDSAGCIWPF